MARSKNSRKRIASVAHGKRMIMGTDWPIESYVDRVEYLGAVSWRLTKLTCWIDSQRLKYEMTLIQPRSAAYAWHWIGF